MVLRCCVWINSRVTNNIALETWPWGCVCIPQGPVAVTIHSCNDVTNCLLLEGPFIPQLLVFAVENAHQQE